MIAQNSLAIIKNEIGQDSGEIRIWSDGTIEIPHIGISLLSIYGRWEEFCEIIKSRSLKIVYKKTVIAQIQYPKNILKHMTNPGPESVDIKIDQATNSLYATSVTVTLRRLLACAADRSEIHQKRNWKLFLNNHRIGVIRIKIEKYGM